MHSTLTKMPCHSRRWLTRPPPDSPMYLDGTPATLHRGEYCAGAAAPPIKRLLNPEPPSHPLRRWWPGGVCPASGACVYIRGLGLEFGSVVLFLCSCIHLAGAGQRCVHQRQLLHRLCSAAPHPSPPPPRSACLPRLLPCSARRAVETFTRRALPPPPVSNPLQPHTFNQGGQPIISTSSSSSAASSFDDIGIMKLMLHAGAQGVGKRVWVFSAARPNQLLARADCCVAVWPPSPVVLQQLCPSPPLPPLPPTPARLRLHVAVGGVTVR